jgi:putative chitinase
MLQITKEQLRYVYPDAPEARIDIYLPFLNKVINQYEINTVQRLRMFLAQVGHESAQLRYTEEIASGVAYEGRLNLGNTQPGDGVRYKGRGLIQLTGRSNYSQCGLALDLPLLEQPELLAQYSPATESAGWFWQNRNLNALCDMGKFEELTKRINGGMNGYPNRYRLYQRALQVIQ